MDPMSHYEFWRLVCLVNIDPTHFGDSNHQVSAVQRRGIRENGGSTPTMNVSDQRETEEKHKYQKRKLDMDISAVMRKIALKKALGAKSPRANDDALQLGGTLDRRLNHDKPHCTTPVTGSVKACQLCQ